MSQYRLLAKATAIFNLVLYTILMLVVIVLVILAGTVVTTTKTYSEILLLKISSPDHPDDADLRAAIWIFCAVVAIGAIFTPIQVWAGVRLLSATEIGHKPVEALRLASSWRNISIVFLVLKTIGILILEMYVWFAINFVLQGVMVYIVFRYMHELKAEELSISSVPVSDFEQEISTSPSIS